MPKFKPVYPTESAPNSKKKFCYSPPQNSNPGDRIRLISNPPGYPREFVEGQKFSPLQTYPTLVNEEALAKILMYNCFFTQMIVHYMNLQIKIKHPLCEK